MKKILFVLFAILLSACNQAQNKISPTAILISNANIVDVRNGAIIKDHQIVIDSGKIQQITSSLKSTEGYTLTIDATDKYAVPGLAEMHAHTIMKLVKVANCTIQKSQLTIQETIPV